MKIKNVFILLSIISIFIIFGCSQGNNKTTQLKEEPKKVDLCGEIVSPTVDASCQTSGCYILVSGDGRVNYLVEYPHIVGGVTNQEVTEISVGQKARIGNKDELDYVRITPFVRQDSGLTHCREKSVIVGSKQFK